jgi:hypothetical protein
MPFKKGSISREVAMPRSSCIHRALPPSGPPDGVHRCSLEGSASGPPPPAISPPESSRSWWWCRSCLLLAAVRGALPRGGWLSSAIARLQGFSSYSPAATSRRWSFTRMITSIMVERSEPGYGLPPPSASRMFIILAGVESEPSWGLAFRMGWRPASSSSIRGRRAFTSHAEEANFGYAGSAGCRRRQLPRVWLLGLDGFGAASGAASCYLVGAWLSVHSTGDGRAVLRSATSMASPAPPAAPGGRTRRRTPRGDDRVFGWSCPHSRRRTGARTSSRVLRQPPPTGTVVAAVIGAEVVAAAGEAARCRGGCLCWRDHQCHLPPSLQLFGFNGLVVAPRRKTGARTFSQWRTR